MSQIVDSSGAPIEPEKSQFTWKQLSIRSRAVIAFVIATVATLSLFVANFSQVIEFFSSPSPKIEIDDLDAIDGNCNLALRLYVRNAGERRGTITEANLEILDIVLADRELDQPSPAPPPISASYDASIKSDVATPFTVALPQVAQTLAPDEADAFDIICQLGGRAIACRLRVTLQYSQKQIVQSEPVVVSVLPVFYMLHYNQHWFNRHARSLSERISALKGKRTIGIQEMIDEMEKVARDGA